MSLCIHYIFLDNFEFSTSTERVRGKISGTFRARNHIKARCPPDFATLKTVETIPSREKQLWLFLSPHLAIFSASQQKPIGALGGVSP